METFHAHLNVQTKINLALSYENDEIIKKFSSEQSIEMDLAREYFIEVKKFLYLCCNTTEILAPSFEIDKIWHTFILFTKEYRLYCINFLGKFIDHVPQVPETNLASSENYLSNTIHNYFEVFGALDNRIWQLPTTYEVKNFDDSCSSYISCSSWSSSEPQEHSCVYTGNCFNCTGSGQSCVGQNPNDL